MKEMLDVIRAYEEAQRLGRRTALATVVHVEGSAYRRPGARMLVDDAGQLTGAISGGCLEGDALRKALLVLTQQHSRLVTYDTMDEDDAKLGIGLGCNGIIQVLFEPVDPLDANNPIALLKAIEEGRRKAVLVTLFSLLNKREEQPGTCLLWKEDGMVLSKGLTATLNEALVKDAKLAYEEKTSSFKNYVTPQDNLTAFIEYVPPPLSLVVIGAGNDVVPLVRIADILGWQTTVVDGRPSHARPDRFTPGCRVLVAKPEQALGKVVIDDQTAVVLMTHNYNYDLAMLRALIGGEAAYIGSLGPHKKLERMLQELQAEGVEISALSLSRVHGPSGLDIGSETPEEIALSIVAEIKSVLAGCSGLSLSSKGEVIHSREGTRIQKVDLR